MKKFYQIEGDDNQFRSLRNAKHYVYLCYTHEERMKHLKDASIVQLINDKVVTKTPIIITTDGYSFGKTIKI